MFDPTVNASSLGLIVTELVINAIKHALPDRPRGAEITISYLIKGDDWSLIVADNGVGKSESSKSKADGGLGTSIVSALAKQLTAVVATQTSQTGLSVTIGNKEAA